ncbi:hypothetical protein BC937DRAFT_87626 [Endogone sp. FLAS-F59071]|nr:hypothetical protein BC937DRAFT_87626 [Endogone sp. FLAS-F59071]|eukprot:RUS19351.1 hypothetical protein BC937DRAFT_87626 [Endogone sp. FLAS-F59071]
MRDFSFELDVTAGEYGYALSTLEGVIHYILGNAKPLSVISRRNKRYWHALKRGDVAFVRKMHRIRNEGSYFEGVGAIDEKGIMENDEDEDEEEEEESEESESTQEMEDGQAVVSEKIAILGSEGVIVAPESHDWDAKPLPPIPETLEPKDLPPIVITSAPNPNPEFDEKQGNGLGYLVAHSDSDSDADDELLSRSTPSIAPGTPSSSVLQTRDRLGDTALLMACRSGNAELVSLLLEEQGGCSPRDVNYRRETPLMITAIAGHVDVVKILLEDPYVRETLEQEDAEGNTALLYACQGAGGELYEPSHKARGDDPSDETARERRALACLELLLAAGATLRTRNHSAGANPVLISAAGATPAHRALLKRLAQVASLEVLNARDNAGRTVFHLLDDPHVAQILIDRGVEPDWVDDEANRRWTPLLAWASEGRTEMVRFLVGLPDEMVQKTRVDSLGRTAMHLACEAGNVDCVRALLECAEILRVINERNEANGGTALHIAAGWWKKRGNTVEDEVQREMAIVGMLVEAGADPDVRDWDGVRAVEEAEDEGVKDLLDDCSLFRRPVKESGGRVCAVTRASFDPANPMKATEYVVKSGVPPSPTTITTVRRTLDDFCFLRQQLAYEHPESCIPTLDDFLESPWLVLDARVGGAPVPSAAVMATSVRRLDRFLNYLVEHPALSMHELLWEFMLVNEIQRAQIQARSQGKRDLALERIQDEYSSALEDPAHEEKYFVYARETVIQLEKAVKEVLRRARTLQRCWQDLGAEMKLLTQNMAKHPDFDFPDKMQYVRGLYKSSLAMSNKYPSDIVHVGDMLEDFSFVVKGTVSALQRPQGLLVELANIERQILRHNSNLKRPETWHELISTTDRRRKLEEAEEQIALLQLQASALASRLNYSHQAVSDEMTHFQLRHTEELRDTLQNYARAQYEAEKGRLRDMMAVMEELGLAKGTQKEKEELAR